MCKPISLEELGELYNKTDYFKKDQNEVSGVVAFLIGVKEENLSKMFKHEENEYEKLTQNDSAVIIRNLCSFRTKLLTHFSVTDQAIKSVTPLITMELYENELKTLQAKGITNLAAKNSVNQYVIEINKILSNRIDECRALFPDWVEWKYIRNLFIMPDGQNEKSVRAEGNKIRYKFTCYPFGCYINWDPQGEGNILISDKKFLAILYAMNNDYFKGYSKVTDASENVKNSIYGFINKNRKIDVVVDCENSDAYRLYSTLMGLEDEEIAKINKVILYDDVHTTVAWKMLTEEFSGIINFEYILVERLNDGKSLVDHKMIADIAKEHYRENVDAFIVASSDSDYWAIIESLPEAEFLVMVEQEKVGRDIITALDEKEIFYCYINDFCTSKTGEFQNKVLNAELNRKLEEIININAHDLMDSVYRDARVFANEVEKKNYYEKNIKTLKLVIDANGNMAIA